MERAIVRAAIAIHRQNQQLYRDVMRGTLKGDR